MDFCIFFRKYSTFLIKLAISPGALLTLNFYFFAEMISEPEKGTTNLHLDVSDAVNILVHVTTPENIDPTEFFQSIFHILEQNRLAN